MQTVEILLQQLLTMLVYIAIGFTLFRLGLISREGSRALTNLLLYVVLPCVIVRAFFLDRTPETTRLILVSFAVGAGLLALAMAVSALLFRRRPVDNFGASFSNAGFIGIPLITAVLGADSVCYITGMIAMLNVLQWTYGQALLSGDPRRMAPTAVLKSPLVWAFLLGLAAFASGLRPPALLSNCMGAIAGCNAPLAMIVLGVFLGQMTLREIFGDVRAYVCCAVRLLLIPLLSLFLMRLLPARFEAVCMPLLIAAAAPVGSNVASYAQKLDLDYAYASKIVCLSTLLSVVTLPALLLLAQKL